MARRELDKAKCIGRCGFARLQSRLTVRDMQIFRCLRLRASFGAVVDRLLYFQNDAVIYPMRPAAPTRIKVVVRSEAIRGSQVKK